MFKKDSHKFVKENSTPSKKDGKVEIKYFAQIENIIKRPSSKLDVNNLHIWTNNHVKEYIGNKTAFIWVLRTYELKEPFIAEKNRATLYVNLKKGSSLKGMSPVLSDKEFKLLNSKL